MAEYNRRTDIKWRKVYRGGIARHSDDYYAERLGCAKSTVRRNRQELGVPPYQPRSRAKGIRWAELEIDWSRSNVELAAELGCSHQAVAAARQRHAPTA